MKLKLRPKKEIDSRLLELFRGGKWTREPNAVLEAIMHNDTGLGKNDAQILWAVIRETFGRQRLSNRIFRARIQNWTGLGLSVISHRLTSLRRRNILKRFAPHSWEHRRAGEWGIEPDPTKWQLPDRSGERIAQGVNRPQNDGANHALESRGNRPTYKEKLKDRPKERRASIEKRNPRY